MPNLPVFNKGWDIMAFNGNEVCKTPINIYYMHDLNTDRNYGYEQQTLSTHSKF
jgi:hypothetical protein